MKYSFTAKGHRNILSSHKKTFEFTKDKEVSLDGDCIVGVEADFSTAKLKELQKRHKRLRMRITAGNTSDEIEFIGNRGFSSNDELVLRLSEFNSERTYGVRADKAAVGLNKKLREKLRNPEQKIDVEIEPVVKAILFDFDDTLVDFKSGLQKAHEMLAKKIFERHNVYGPTTVKLLYDIDLKYCRKAPNSSPELFDRHIWIKEYFISVGIKVTKKEIDELVMFYWRFVLEGVRPMPHAEKVLAGLKKWCKIAVMTDSDGNSHTKIERAKISGLMKYIDVFIDSDKIHKNKPNKTFYEKILKKLDVLPHECIMVGDKPQVDLKLAKSLGMKTVWIKHGLWSESLGGTFSYVDYTITDLKQLPEVMRSI